ncbi:hypothetical protein E9549_20275 [Blastococcus sp. MG754426]|uniref:DUF6318 family protein n=1 Tax=unclassified Blastococcus TaxID=2619396 RepID=UPI001EF025F8|nr:MULTISPECIES: DUF6318 family protein [unclassified Blastococcus]MCF6509710.1 hypothetical protein [Blastococcus sp. MG754426]MCF6514104.1 hypothetical protein [Blastococcus sp. MG754427]
MLASTVLLTGCAEKQQASTSLPTTEPAPTTESLPPLGPADLPMPNEARTQDAAGAEAFLRYWIDLLNHQRAIPSGEEIRALGPECQDCLRIAGNYDDAASAGNRYEGGELSLNDVTAPLIDRDEVMIAFGARREAVSLLDAKGALLESRAEPAPNLSSGITLVWSSADHSWLVKGFTLG